MAMALAKILVDDDPAIRNLIQRFCLSRTIKLSLPKTVRLPCVFEQFLELVILDEFTGRDWL